jgi:hypothetical protein
LTRRVEEVSETTTKSLGLGTGHDLAFIVGSEPMCFCQVGLLQREQTRESEQQKQTSQNTRKTDHVAGFAVVFVISTTDFALTLYLTLQTKNIIAKNPLECVAVATLELRNRVGLDG